MEALAAETKSNELLSRIPGRICTNAASNMACVFTQQGRKGTNQDAMVVWENFASRKDTIFCGVFDGHGPYGHLVARRVRDVLPSKLMAIWKASMRGEDDANSESDWWTEAKLDSGLVLSPSKEPEMFTRWRNSMLKTFNQMDQDLRTHPVIDCFCSGTTTVTVLKQGDELVIGNVGDSRAVLGSRREDDTLDAIQLTVDLKPSLPKEAERIRSCRGRVFALDDEPDVARVWLPYDDAPGLAMARAFGDFCLKDFGLISVPEVTYRKLTNKDEFIVLATDGVWDVLSNTEVVDVVSSATTKASAARAVVEAASRAWRLKYPTSKMDDCAVVCLFLHESSSSIDKFNGVHKSTTHNTTDQEVDQRESCIEDQSHPDDHSLGRSNTLRTSHPPDSNFDSNDNEKGTQVVHNKQQQTDIVREKGTTRIQALRNVAHCLSSTAVDEEWSALQGVVRVNSLVHLPRFLMGDRRASASRKKQ